MITCSKSLRSVLAVIVLLGVVLCPAAVPASSSTPDTAAAAPDHSAAVATAPVPPDSPGSLSPMAALGVGLAATVGPPLLVVALTPRESRAEDVGLFVGVAAGVIAGPAVGLWSGGRGDLAKRGLIIRAIGGAAVGAGALGVALAMGESSQQTQAITATLVVLGVVGGAITTASLFHDLAITPSATSQGKPPRVGLGIRSNGSLAVRVQF